MTREDLLTCKLKGEMPRVDRMDLVTHTKQYIDIGLIKATHQAYPPNPQVIMFEILMDFTITVGIHSEKFQPKGFGVAFAVTDNPEDILTFSKQRHAQVKTP